MLRGCIYAHDVCPLQAHSRSRTAETITDRHIIQEQKQHSPQVIDYSMLCTFNVEVKIDDESTVGNNLRKIKHGPHTNNITIGSMYFSCRFILLSGNSQSAVLSWLSRWLFRDHSYFLRSITTHRSRYYPIACCTMQWKNTTYLCPFCTYCTPNHHWKKETSSVFHLKVSTSSIWGFGEF